MGRWSVASTNGDRGDESRPTPSKAQLGGARNRRGGLGRGLGALIPTAAPSPQRPGDAEVEAGGLRAVPIETIDVNPFQPRTTMESAALDELAASIRAHGIVQPLLVVAGQRPETYLLIAGERRWRAARQ